MQYCDAAYSCNLKFKNKKTKDTAEEKDIPYTVGRIEWTLKYKMTKLREHTGYLVIYHGLWERMLSRSWPDQCIVPVGWFPSLCVVLVMICGEKLRKMAEVGNSRDGQKKRVRVRMEQRGRKRNRKPWSVTQYRRKCHIDKCNTVWSISYITDYVKQLPCAFPLDCTHTLSIVAISVTGCLWRGNNG